MTHHTMRKINLEHTEALEMLLKCETKVVIVLSATYSCSFLGHERRGCLSLKWYRTVLSETWMPSLAKCCWISCADFPLARMRRICWEFSLLMWVISAACGDARLGDCTQVGPNKPLQWCDPTPSRPQTTYSSNTTRPLLVLTSVSLWALTV